MSRIKRFIEYHEKYYETALTEIKKHLVISNWMNYIFPQIRGLSIIEVNEEYLIKDIEEAKEYLENDTLRNHMIEIIQALLDLGKSNLIEIKIDEVRLNSCMTLFKKVEEIYEIDCGKIFQKALNKLFEGKEDNKTILILEKQKLEKQMDIKFSYNNKNDIEVDYKLNEENENENEKNYPDKEISVERDEINNNNEINGNNNNKVTNIKSNDINEKMEEEEKEIKEINKYEEIKNNNYIFDINMKVKEERIEKDEDIRTEEPQNEIIENDKNKNDKNIELKENKDIYNNNLLEEKIKNNENEENIDESKEKNKSIDKKETIEEVKNNDVITEEIKNFIIPEVEVNNNNIKGENIINIRDDTNIKGKKVNNNTNKTHDINLIIDNSRLEKKTTLVIYPDYEPDEKKCCPGCNIY